MPGKGKIAFIKSGKSTTYASYIWTTKSGNKLKGAYSKKKYTSRNAALKVIIHITYVNNSYHIR